MYLTGEGYLFTNGKITIKIVILCFKECWKNLIL